MERKASVGGDPHFHNARRGNEVDGCFRSRPYLSKGLFALPVHFNYVAASTWDTAEVSHRAHHGVGVANILFIVHDELQKLLTNVSEVRIYETLSVLCLT